MNTKTLSQVLIRVWGVVLLVSALASSGNVFLFLGGAGEWRGPAVASFINVLFSFAAGICFVRYGDQIGAWLASDLPDGSGPSSSLEVLSAAFAVLGAYFLVTGLRNGAVVGVELFTKPKWEETATAAYVWERQRQTIVTSVVDTLAGIILLFGRHNIVAGWSRWWRVIRSRQENGGE